MKIGRKLQQVIPILLTFITFLSLWGILYLLILALNLLPAKMKIILILRKRDILIGLAIYLKTSVDFAIFIGNLMHSNPGWKKRIAIELGTALGNGLGTLLVLIIWTFFKEIPVLMALMITAASLILLRMAQESLEEFLKYENFAKVHSSISLLQKQLNFINSLSGKLLKPLIPNLSIINAKMLSFANLAMFSITIPFILGLDDFAGYIPLFSIVNVYGFAVGVFLGHMLLNLGLFLSPGKTTAVVRHPIVLILGGLAFVGISLWGFWEVIKILQLVFVH
ncbi:MAG: hypothetical protein M1372_01450 [Patescibacteria group bacterium]|nr:hypothetical protein [Patescibacteria group bacterium]